MDHYNTIIIFYGLLPRTYRFSQVYFFADIKAWGIGPASTKATNYWTLREIEIGHGASYSMLGMIIY